MIYVVNAYDVEGDMYQEIVTFSFENVKDKFLSLRENHIDDNFTEVWQADEHIGFYEYINGEFVYISF